MTWAGFALPLLAFENFYPGGDVTDAIGFSGYNFGGCPAAYSARPWDLFPTALKPYLDRMRIMAPSKPLFVAQTGTVNVPNTPANPAETNHTRSAPPCMRSQPLRMTILCG